MNKMMKGLAGLVIGAGAIAAVNYSCSNIHQEVEVAPIVKLETRGREQVIYKSIESYLQDFIGRYVDSMAPVSSEIRDNISYYEDERKKGKVDKSGREIVIRGYFDIYSSCLDLAIKNIGKDISANEFDALGKRLAGIHNNMAKKTEMKLMDPCVSKAYSGWGREKVKLFQKIISSNLKTNASDFGEMVRNSYSFEDFKIELERQNEIEKKLYNDGFKQSLPVTIRWIGSGIIDKTQEESWKRNREECYRFYSDKK